MRTAAATTASDQTRTVRDAWPACCWPMRPPRLSSPLGCVSSSTCCDGVCDGGGDGDDGGCSDARVGGAVAGSGNLRHRRRLA